MYNKGFWIQKPVGNNIFQYLKRIELGSQGKIRVSSIIKGNLQNIQIGDKIVFEEISNNGDLQSFVGLKNFVKMEIGGIPTHVFDNHNHALFFRAETWKLGLFDSGVDVIHIDQHSDLNTPENMPDFDLVDNNLIEKVWKYANFEINVGNFILPAQKLCLIGNCHQIRTENMLLNLDWNMSKKYILDIDLDFWAPEMGIENMKNTIKKLKN